MGVATFATAVEVNINLNEYQNHTSLDAAISDIKCVEAEVAALQR